MKELRFGLVCYGGISLAIYMHGITSELHKLVKASNRYANSRDGSNPFGKDTTEHVYFEILRQIAAGEPLLVIVDVIAGTSAGGINGIALAKALARNLDQAPLKQVWFRKASIWKLLSPWKLFRCEAILNGDRMLRWVHQALGDMNKTAEARGKSEPASLMPDDHKLDLFVTLTDYTGYRRPIDIRDPGAIYDREHRHVLTFSYNRDDGIDDFGPHADPGLALAIRCTSSFPVAFGPVGLDDIGAVAKSWKEADRKAFTETAFAHYLLAKAKPESAYFLDGGVLNNRPFDHAVQAILERPAKSEVDRRLLFIEPHPEPAPAASDTEAMPTRPRLAQTARAALISIPRQQPIAGALLELTRNNQRVLQIKHLIQVLKPEVDYFIKQVIKKPVHDIGVRRRDSGVPKFDKLETWRKAVRKRVETKAGPAFHSYAALKISAVLEQLATGICRLQHYPPGSRHAILVARVVQAWAERFGIVTGKPVLTAKQSNFLEFFDLAYRRRRLSFLVEYINRLYLPSTIADLPPREEVDAAKKGLYALMAELQLLRPGEWLGEETLQQLNEVFGRGVIEEADDPIEKADGDSDKLSAFLNAHYKTLTKIFEELQKELENRLKAFYDKQAEELARFAKWNWEKPIIGDLLARYVGFAYWDLLLYPIQALSRVAELNTIEVTRISPEDTKALEPRGVTKRLKGITFGGAAPVSSGQAA